MIKKIISYFMCMIVLSFSSGCSNAPQKSIDDTFDIVCTIAPYYDWARNITKDAKDVSLSLLVNDGSDLHSYQPSTEDILKLTNCDILIYTGGTSDAWVEEVLKSTTYQGKTIKLMDYIENPLSLPHSVTEENHSHSENEIIDEHIWLSVKNAISLTSVIADTFISENQENQAIYEENKIAYTQALKKLDSMYAEAFPTPKTLIFADRFPFVYLANDYNLSYHIAFSGCSADSESDFETVMELAKKADLEKASAIFVTDNQNLKLSTTVISNTASQLLEIASLKSMQASTLSSLDDESYYDIMLENLEVLKRVFN